MMNIKLLKAGKLRNVSHNVFEAIQAILECGETGCWNFQPIGDTFAENGVGILQPVLILDSQDTEGNDVGKEKLTSIARLLAVDVEELSQYNLIEVWDDR